MSLVTFIRDYVDVAINSDQLDSYTLSSLTYHVFTFFFTIGKQAFLYCLTFQWLRDFSYFSLTPPLLLSTINGIGLNLGVGLFGPAQNPENEPLYHLLVFSDSSFSVGIVFLGFLNGCFSCLQLSAANLLTIQRMLVQGVPAGLCSAFGTAVGQFFFVGSVLFGFRGLLFPWLALEPLHFLVGVCVTLSVASAIAQDRRTPTIQWSAKFSLFICAFTSFILAWCEQAALFQWVGNISFGAEPSFLETSPFLVVNNTVFGNAQQLIQNGSYLFAFFLGSILGAYFIGFLLQRFLEFLLRYKGIAVYYGLIKQANLPLATLIFAFGFGSLPYYGLDYLITKGFGFAPNEDFFKQTLFSPTNLVSKTSQAKDVSQGRLEDQLALLFTLEGERSKSFAVDTTPFDNGQYLKAKQKRPQTFEDLNYRGEHLWTNRLSRISNIREQANQTQSSFLGPVFSWMRSFLWGSGPTTTNNETSGITSYLRKAGTASDLSFATSYGDKEGVLYEGSETNPLPPTPEGGTEGGSFASLDDEADQPYIVDWSPSSKNESKLPSLATHIPPTGAASLRKQRSKRQQKDGEVGSPPSEAPQKLIFDNIKLKKKELSSENEQVDNYVKEFSRQFDKGFSNFDDADPHSLIEVEDQWQEKRIKEKCYTNPIYKFLLNVEIDAFLSRQPTSHWLSPQEEVLLLKRRQLLNSYYDTLALTSQVSASGALDQLVPKSYANAVYNHQFKGTLKVARRLFSVKKFTTKPNNNFLNFVDSNNGSTAETLPSDHKPALNKKANQPPSYPPSGGTGKKQTRIIKFDQPLFSKEKNHAQQSLFHEELGVDVNKSSASHLRKTSEGVGSKMNAAMPATFASEGGQANEKNSRPSSEAKQASPFFTELSSEGKDTLLKPENTFLLEQAESMPLYAGWDEQLRKLVLTNRFQNQALAGYTFSKFPTPALSSEANKGGWQALTPEGGTEGGIINSTETESSTVFTTWPIPNPFFKTKNNIKDGNTVPTKQDPPSGGLPATFVPEGGQGWDQGESTDYRTNHKLDKGEISETNFWAERDKPNQVKVNGKAVKNDIGVKANDANNTNSTVVDFVTKRTKFLPSLASQQVDSVFIQNKENRFLFKNPLAAKQAKEETPITNDMVNALLQWQKLIKENKQLSKEDKQAAKERVTYWPENVNRAQWFNEPIDSDIEIDEPNESTLKKETFLWEFTPPNHGGFIWSGNNWNN